MIRPVNSGDSCRTCCRYRESTSISPPFHRPSRKASVVPSRSPLRCSRAGLISGAGCLVSAFMKTAVAAARAGVGSTTIYRRWPSKGLLALDAFVDSFREEQPLPDTGTLRGDLLSSMYACVRTVTETAMGPMLTGLIAEAQHDPELREAWRDRV